MNHAPSHHERVERTPDDGGYRQTGARVVRTAARVALAGFLLVAGLGHFLATDAFLAQVPPWLPAPRAVVWVSGAVELALGVALLGAGARHRPLVGWLVAALFVAVFPGNVSQFLTGTDAFGLETGTARAVRLGFQPLLVVWALWSTGAWRAWRERRGHHVAPPERGRAER